MTSKDWLKWHLSKNMGSFGWLVCGFQVYRYGVAKEKGFLAQKATVKFRELLGLDSCSNKLRLFLENCMWFEIFIHVKMSVNFALFPLL